MLRVLIYLDWFEMICSIALRYQNGLLSTLSWPLLDHRALSIIALPIICSNPRYSKQATGEATLDDEYTIRLVVRTRSHRSSDTFGPRCAFSVRYTNR